MTARGSQKVAVITGASQGIGAGLVAAYRKLGYAAVATSREDVPLVVELRDGGPGLMVRR